MQGKKVLIVDDDIMLCRSLTLAFKKAGAQTFVAHDGREGLQSFFENRPDLVILDIMMPDMDGWETCRQIRVLSNTPIIMLTTLQNEKTIIRALDYGADDFISKPFSVGVLQARARAVLRRAEASVDPDETVIYRDDYLEIDVASRKVLVRGEPVKLTSTEFRLLSYLVQNAGRVNTYAQILQNVWGWEYRDSTDYVHVYLSHLRRKLEEDPRQPQYLLNEHGVGYYFTKVA